jgi:hypothetical protein
MVVMTIANSHYQNVSMHSTRIDEDQGSFSLEWEIPEDFRLGVAKLKFTQVVRPSPVCGLVSIFEFSSFPVMTERQCLLSDTPAHPVTVWTHPHR